jgi:hypothetical protein
MLFKTINEKKEGGIFMLSEIRDRLKDLESRLEKIRGHL